MLIIHKNKATVHVTPHVSKPRINSKDRLKDICYTLDGDSMITRSPLQNATNSPTEHESNSFEELMSRAEADEIEKKPTPPGPTPRLTSMAAPPSRIPFMDRLSAYNQPTTTVDASSGRRLVSTSSVVPQKRDSDSFEVVSNQNKGEETDAKTTLYPDAKRPRISDPLPSPVASAYSSNYVDAAGSAPVQPNPRLSLPSADEVIHQFIQGNNWSDFLGASEDTLAGRRVTTYLGSVILALSSLSSSFKRLVLQRAGVH